MKPKPSNADRAIAALNAVYKEIAREAESTRSAQVALRLGELAHRVANAKDALIVWRDYQREKTT